MNVSSATDLHRLIRSVPDFPRPGILFRDITPILQHAGAFNEAIDRMAELVDGEQIDLIAAPEARGFIFAAPLATRLGCGFVPIRKQGKLPYKVTTVTYDLEYGQDTIAMHVDAVTPGARVVLVDDVLATGGTMKACADLVESRGALVGSCLFFLELEFLAGRTRLKDYRVHSFLRE